METRSVRFRTEHRTQNVLRWIFAGIIGLALVLLILFGWFSPVYVADESMVPTLEKGDTVFYDRLYKHFYDLKRGDMVAFRDAEGNLLIKRVVALSGESRGEGRHSDHRRTLRARRAPLYADRAARHFAYARAGGQGLCAVGRPQFRRGQPQPRDRLSRYGVDSRRGARAHPEIHDFYAGALTKPVAFVMIVPTQGRRTLRLRSTLGTCWVMPS